MGSPPFRPPPQNPFTNPASLPNWMRGISEAKWEANRRRVEAQEHLKPVVRRANPTLTPQQQQVLERHLSSLQREAAPLFAAEKGDQPLRRGSAPTPD
jgi:hypothetical protein